MNRRRDGTRSAGTALALVAAVAAVSLLAAACADDPGGPGSDALDDSEPSGLVDTAGADEPDGLEDSDADDGGQASENLDPPDEPSADTDADTDTDAAEQDAGVDTVEAGEGADAAGNGSSGVLDGESIEWADCGGADCGHLSVPLDYNDPDSAQIAIAVLVHRATRPQERIGYLLVNPGGPGGSGVDMAHGAALGPGMVFSAEVIERFDIVGFDPRGVGQSEPSFQCGRSGESAALLAAAAPYDSPEALAAGEAAARLCVESMGAAAGLLHSEFVARDMDELRKALGADQISYYGASYGSTLGVWYATLFGERVRAMVVDGADNPVDDTSTQEARIANVLDETAQFEVLLGDALDACDSPVCPIHNDGDPRGYFAANAHRLEAVADAAGGNPLAGALGVITTLYAEQLWPALWQGLAELVEQDDPAILAQLAAVQLGEDGGGITFTQHVNCLDSWSLDPQLDREVRLGDETAMVAAFEERFPLLSLMEINLPPTCPFYDGFAPPPLGRPLDGGGVPILVIGNPTDPATPFSESQELVADTLADGHLLEADHPAHVVYPANACAVEAVHAVLIDLRPPADLAGTCPSS